MKEELVKLLDKSRSDYFNFPVSAGIVTTKGIFYGVNVETSSPSAGICAERNALYNAITNGITKKDIKEIHVMSKKSVTPCFICRQALVDFCNDNVKVYVYNLDGLKNEYTVSELCTHTFGKGDLEWNQGL